MNATPRPWKVNRIEPGKRGAGGGYSICAVNNMPILFVADGEVNRSNAALIVRAVNSFDEAKAALEQYLQALRHAPIEGCYGKDARYNAEAVLAKMEGNTP